MNNLKEYFIPFVGLKLGKHQFDYSINNTFFNFYNYEEFNNVNVKVNVTLDKKTTFLELLFKHSGTVNVPCDITNEPFDLPIKGKLKLVVKFGDEFNDDNEEMLILPHGEYQINIAQYIYEMIVLSVPFKRLHPGLKDGSISLEALNTLEKLSPKEKKIKENNKNTDPRWDSLKKLITDKNNK